MLTTTWGWRPVGVLSASCCFEPCFLSETIKAKIYRALSKMPGTMHNSIFLITEWNSYLTTSASVSLSTTWLKSLNLLRVNITQFCFFGKFRQPRSAAVSHALLAPSGRTWRQLRFVSSSACPLVRTGFPAAMVWGQGRGRSGLAFSSPSSWCVFQGLAFLCWAGRREGEVSVL